jgi:hypothetical protein
MERIEQTRMETEDRDEIAQSALRLCGTTPSLAPGWVRSTQSFLATGGNPGAPYTHAHNDYLQFAAKSA